MKTQTLEAIIAAVAMLTLVATLGFAMAETLRHDAPTTAAVPPAPAAPPIDPEAQRLINELREQLRVPAYYRVPAVADVKHAKVWM